MKPNLVDYSQFIKKPVKKNIIKTESYTFDKYLGSYGDYSDYGSYRQRSIDYDYY